MVEKRPPAAITPETEELIVQLAESRQIQAEGDAKAVRGEETAGEMSKILRRIADAMDRNPQSWDALLLQRRQR